MILLSSEREETKIKLPIGANDQIIKDIYIKFEECLNKERRIEVSEIH